MKNLEILWKRAAAKTADSTGLYVLADWEEACSSANRNDNTSCRGIDSKACYMLSAATAIRQSFAVSP